MKGTEVIAPKIREKQSFSWAAPSAKDSDSCFLLAGDCAHPEACFLTS